MRQCGECTLCCQYFKVTETNSPEYEYCTYCEPGNGCSIYEDRPKECRATSCLWYKQEQIPKSLRPDKLGICFELPSFCRVMIGYLSKDRRDAWKTPIARQMIYKIMQAGHPVVLTCGPGTGNIYFVPEGWTQKQVIDELYISFNRTKKIVT